MDVKKTKKGSDFSFVGLIMNNKALIILIVFSIVLSCLTDKFLTSKNLINILRQVSVSIILGVGFTLTLGTGNLDLSVGAMLGLVSMVTCKIAVLRVVPFPVIILLGIAFGAFCGFLNGYLSQTFKIPAMITTVAMKNVFQGLTYIISKNSTVSDLPAAYTNMGQGYVFELIPIPVLIMLAMVILGYVVLNRTTFGRRCLAVGGNSEAARVSGINVKAIKIASFVWMGMCAGLAAMVYAGRVGSGQVSAGNGMEMDIMAGVVIGGTTIGGGNGKIIGTVVGCLMVQVINNGMQLLSIDTNWQVVAKGLLILIAVTLDSQGEQLLVRRMAKKAE